MARGQIGSYHLSEQELNLVTTIFRDPISTNHFIKLLQRVQSDINRQGDQSKELFLMNNDPQTRAVALLAKGKDTMLNDIVSLLQAVNK